MNILRFINVYIIDGLFIAVMSIAVTSKYWPEFSKVTALKIVRYFVLSYCLLYLLSFVIEPMSLEFLKRANGYYFSSYLLMLILHCFLPLLLFFKKIAQKLWLVFIITMLMDVGMLFEKFVIIVTTFHRDYFAVNQQTDALFESGIMAIVLIGGVVITGLLVYLVILGITLLLSLKDKKLI